MTDLKVTCARTHANATQSCELQGTLAGSSTCCEEQSGLPREVNFQSDCICAETSAGSTAEALQTSRIVMSCVRMMQQGLPRECRRLSPIKTFFSTLLTTAVSRFSLSTFSRTRPSTISSKHSGNLAPRLPCKISKCLVNMPTVSASHFGGCAQRLDGTTTAIQIQP